MSRYLLAGLALASFLAFSPMKAEGREDEEIMDIEFHKSISFFDSFFLNLDSEMKRSVNLSTRYHLISNHTWLLEKDKYWGWNDYLEDPWLDSDQDYKITNPFYDSMNLLVRDSYDALLTTLEERESFGYYLITNFKRYTSFSYDFQEGTSLEREQDLLARMDEEEKIEYYKHRKKRSMFVFSAGGKIGTPAFYYNQFGAPTNFMPYAYVSGFNDLVGGQVDVEGTLTLYGWLKIDDLFDMKRRFRLYSSYTMNPGESTHPEIFQLGLKLDRFSVRYRLIHDENYEDGSYYSLGLYWSFLW